MEVNVMKQNVTINKLVSTKKELVIVEGDVIVPDVKPDILNTINTVGNVCIYKKEVFDGKVRFDGSVNLDIIYLADSESDTIRGITTAVDFTQTIEVENCRAGMELRNNITIKEIECKVLNGRKINTKIVLEINVYIYSNEEINVLREVNNINGVQILNSNIQINNLIGTGNCRASAKDNISLQEGDCLAEILKSEIKIINSENKVSYNKVLLKSDVAVKIMYLSENGDIKVVSSNIPLMGFIDIPNVSENNVLNSHYEIKNILVKANMAEKKSICIEVEVEICLDVLDIMEIQLIKDMYCIDSKLDFEQKEINTITNKQIDRSICNIKERISIPEISNNKIYDVEINPNISNVNILNERIVYEGDLKLNFIFSSDANNRINTRRYTIPFTYTIDNEMVSPNKTINTEVNCIDDEFVVTTDGVIDCRVNLEFRNEMYENANINIIDEVEMSENNDNSNPSMIVYIVKEGDTIWNIAKKYKTTMQEIININNLDNGDEIFVGEKLFIPRFYMNRIA